MGGLAACRAGGPSDSRLDAEARLRPENGLAAALMVPPCYPPPQTPFVGAGQAMSPAGIRAGFPFGVLSLSRGLRSSEGDIGLGMAFSAGVVGPSECGIPKAAVPRSPQRHRIPRVPASASAAASLRRSAVGAAFPAPQRHSKSHPQGTPACRPLARIGSRIDVLLCRCGKSTTPFALTVRVFSPSFAAFRGVPLRRTTTFRRPRKRAALRPFADRANAVDQSIGMMYGASTRTLPGSGSAAPPVSQASSVTRER